VGAELKYFLALLLLIVLIAGGAAAWIWYGITKPYQGFSSSSVFVDVPHGASSRHVATLLQSSGVIRSAMAFEIYARRHPKRTLQAGEYLFDHAMTGRDVFWKVANGQVYQQPFTVREGETMFDIARELEAAKFMRAGDFLFAAGDSSLIRDFAPGAPTLEGFLFPATYELPRHPAASELTAEMVHKFKEQWKMIAAQVDAESAAPAGVDLRSVKDIVTLASLVERETPKRDERPLVAGAFENRMAKGMRLQCDPTVMYGMERLGKYTPPLTGKDLVFDSPYNTYEHAGLPPGPIGNPGEASLRAALAPAKTDYLYFVANTQGGHFFSATLEEHNKNVTRYRRLLAGLPADPPPPPPKPKTKPKAKKKQATSKQQKGKAR
jgi:UPF0755 protein